MNIATPYDVNQKTCWIFLKPHVNIAGIESGKILGRISNVDEKSITLCDVNNKAQVIFLSEIERIAKCNREFHINFMKCTLENVLS